MKTRLYVPTEQDIEDCLTGKGCEYGICDECTRCKEREEDESEDE